MKNNFAFFVIVSLTVTLLSLPAIAQDQQTDWKTDWKKISDVSAVQFESHDGHDMFGKLILPKSTAPRAIVIAVQTAEGSTVDMKRPLGRGKTFNYYDLYRKKLTAMDIGFFSYEGRGIRMGDEPPRYEKIDRKSYNSSTLDNKVQDLLSAIKAVRKQKRLQRTPIFLHGASEGTLLAAEAASKAPNEVAGLILYGVMAENLRETFRYIMSGGEFLKYQAIDKDNNNVITKSEWTNAIKEVPFSQADRNSDGQFTVADIEIVTKKYLDAIRNNNYEVLQDWAKTGAAVAVPDGWFEDHFSHPDSWTFFSQLDIPVGCFHGVTDRMAPVAAVRKLEQKAKQSKLTKMEFHYFEGVGHSLNIGKYFSSGELPAGHQAIFDFIDRTAEGAKSAKKMLRDSSSDKRG